MEWLYQLGSAINNLFVGNPLRRLYHDGPTVFGFWGGIDNAHICASLSNAPISLWNANPVECVELVERHFVSMYTVINFFIYVVILYNFMSTLVFYVTVTRPLGANIQQVAKIMIHNDKVNPRIVTNEHSLDSVSKL